jgi:hypothetical protein
MSEYFFTNSIYKISSIWWISSFNREYNKEIDIIASKIMELRTLSDNEIYIFEYFITIGFMFNADISKYNNAVNTYLYNYLSKKMGTLDYNKLAFTTYAIASSLTEEFRGKYAIGIECNDNDMFKQIIMLTQVDNEKNITLKVNKYIFPQENMDKKLSCKVFNKIVLNLCIGFLHETEHIRQFIRMFSGEKGQEIENMIKESILTNNTEFYYTYASNFQIEHDANVYALSNVLEYYHRFIKEDEELEKNTLNKIDENIRKSTIDSVTFNNMFEDKFAKFIKENPEALNELRYLRDDIEELVPKSR